MPFKCEKCKRSFDREYVYEKHINRKTPCEHVIKPDPNADFTCMYCGRTFSRKDVLTRHYTTCKMRKSKHSLVKIKERELLESKLKSDTEIKETELDDHKKLKNDKPEKEHIEIVNPEPLKKEEIQESKKSSKEEQTKEPYQKEFKGPEVNYIYLLQEREFIKTNEKIYKIGRSKQKNGKRFSQYPKGSTLLFQIICEDCVCTEKKLIKLFKTKFKQRKDIGREYFEGNYQVMIDEIYTMIKSEMVSVEDDPDD